MQSSKHLGLKKLRRQSGKTPTYQCSNCKCMRYSPCTCMKPLGYEDKNTPENKSDTPAEA
jgi:hypothetical protein